MLFPRLSLLRLRFLPLLVRVPAGCWVLWVSWIREVGVVRVLTFVRLDLSAPRPSLPRWLLAGAAAGLATVSCRDSGTGRLDLLGGSEK